MITKISEIDGNLETKLFRIGCGVSIVISLTLAILDGFIFKHAEAVIVELTAVALFSFIFWYGKKRDSDALKHIFLGVILLFANISFYIEEGWATPSAIIFFIGILYGTILIKSKYSRIVVWILIIDFIILTVVENLLFDQPKYITYSIEDFRLVHVTYALVSIVTTVLLVDYFKVMYDKERYGINLVNRQLIKANDLLDQKNESLALTEKSIKDQQEVLAKNHQELEKVNREMVDINKYLEETVDKRRSELSKINSDLSLLFYRSSHDFRRPLTTLKGLAQIGKLTDQTELSGKILELVDHTADSMGRMLDKFLMLYQINDLQRFPELSFDQIKTNLENQVKLYGQVDCQWYVETAQFKNNDRRNFLLDIILKNLVENSCLYRNEQKLTIRISVLEQDNQLYLSVWDNGEGIPDDIKDKVFNIYYRGNLKSKGSGLGLFVVENAIKRLKGSCKIESVANEFCQFDIRFRL